MTYLALLLRRLPLALVVIAICATIAESSSSRERRHVEESSHRSSKNYASESWTSSGKLSSSTSNNEITAPPGKRVSHRLMGGHLRLDTKAEDDGDSLWDDGILMSAAGDGKEGKNTRGSGGDDEDEKKTLSQQVKEGKYGLIQNEIYGDRPKRPGIISYAGNPEVPKDTVDNLGGLDEDEIWLAENHVLVLRGGKFPEHGSGQDQDGQRPSDNARWPPIDDYKAPKRQVKIPSRPKIPPPFPVQLTDDGPIQIIGPNGTTENIGNGTLDYSTDPFYTKGLLPGEGPFFPIAPNGTILAPDFGVPPRNFTVEEKSSRGNNVHKGLRPEFRPPEGPPDGPPPFYHAIPPGAVFVPPPPPPSNHSDYDEEDQSIYYPPPYSFHYPRDNTTAVPPGPLVPGIILPPPPDFFSALEEKKTTTTKKYTKRPTTTTTPRSRPTYLPPRKLTTKQYKNPSDTPIPTSKTISTSISMKISFGRTPKNATDILTSKEKTATAGIEITTPTSKKPHILENTEIYTISPVIGNQVSEATTQHKDWSTLVTSKVPVLAYYPSTTPSSLERPVEVTPASIKSIITTGHQPGGGRTGNHASYYFYEESSNENSGGTTNPSPVYHEATTKSPYYNVETSRTQNLPPEQKKHFYVETIAPVKTSSDYKVKLIDTIVKNSQTFHYSDDAEVTSPKLADGTSRDQSQRMLSDEAPVYYQPARPSHSLYYTTPKPQTYYRQNTKPKPIYQYSFQVADYSKRGGNRETYREEQLQLRKQQQDASYGESYRNVQSGTRQYGYEDVASSRGREQSLPLKRIPYNKAEHRPVVYPSATAGYTIADATTANPQHAYFTQQEEKLLDDVTKEYFTIFGKKLPETRIQSTTPIYGKSSSTTEKPLSTYVSTNVYKTGRPVTHKTPNVKVRYGDQRPYSLKDDTLVNYRRPLPPINPDSEFIEVIEPKPRAHQSLTSLSDYELRTENYRLRNHGPISRYGVHATVQPTDRHTNNFVPLAESREELENIGEPVSLLDDIEVNYKDPRPAVNPDAEFIDPVTVQEHNHSDNPNAYFAYRLPGDVGHFYFLTPQAVTQRQDQNDNGGYVYPKPRGPRLLTRRRRRRGEA